MKAYFSTTMVIAASPRIQKYFDALQKDVKSAHHLATQARECGYDPTTFVDIKLAKNLAERVVGLISVIAPQITDTPIVDRIVELEKEYGNQDWRVAMVIAHEVAQQKFCTFESDIQAIEVGIRIGFAYVTVGVVSSPLEGFTHLEIRDRRDGQGKYFCMHFAGPIRNAGGTAAATCVIIGDYVRKQMGYAKYDPDDQEVERCYAEIMDYHDRVTNLQYVPSKKESLFMVSNCPIEINGDPSEKFEVSNYKDLPRVHTNYLRSGYCLIHSSCLPLKAPKLWKQISKWYEQMNMSDWCFLEEFIEIQHHAKAKGDKGNKNKKDAKITPVYTYIADLVGGRPVLGHPMRSGAFRLRYGRSRTSGYSAQSMHPASMIILDGFVAIGTQLKVERPGKAAAFTTCDTIEGPRVLLNDGSIVHVNSVELAKKIHHEVKQILYVGDTLINYGDFFDRAHTLAPPGYCEEWWALELEHVYGGTIADNLNQKIGKETINAYIKEPLKIYPTYTHAKEISHIANIPLHPRYTYFYNEITLEQFTYLVTNHKKTQFDQKLHDIYCLLGIPLQLTENNFEFEADVKNALLDTLVDIPIQHENKDSIVDTINTYAKIKIRDKSGTFIGARMGRPEKGKHRRMSSSPNGLFPVGEQGGRLRSFQSCLETGYIRADCAAYKDANNQLTPFPKTNNKKNEKVYVTYEGNVTTKETPQAQTHCTIQIPFKEVFEECKKILDMQVVPDLIKGVLGMVNQDKYIEHPTKAILRAHHNIFVNKDGTIRYDASEIPITHFKPKEIRTSIEKLKQLGYTHDINGEKLVDEEQTLEIIPQDILLPCCPEAPNRPCDEILHNAANFVDDLLQKLYKLQPYYKLKTKDDLVGHYIIGLAPHTSAGIVGRIIGFTQSQAMYCHPLFHAAMRRDADGDESCYVLLMDAFLNFSTHFLPSSRGGTMDAPLVLTSLLDPAEVDDMAFNVDVCWKYPLEFYKAAQEYKMPWDIKIHLLGDDLHTPQQFEGFGFTHDTNNINEGVLCSAYKILPSMQEKVQGQMALAEKIRAVDQNDVARIVIQTHFMRDTRGNLRKYSMQEFRCVKCNTKYRRPPLVGVCTQPNCHGKILFTISQGSIVKYLEPSINLAEKYDLPNYLQQSLELTKMHIEGIFGRDKEKQTGLGEWF
jgi:DNA polymerase II large subunit